MIQCVVEFSGKSTFTIAVRQNIPDFVYEFRNGRDGRNREFPNFHDGN